MSFDGPHLEGAIEGDEEQEISEWYKDKFVNEPGYFDDLLKNATKEEVKTFQGDIAENRELSCMYVLNRMGISPDAEEYDLIGSDINHLFNLAQEDIDEQKISEGRDLNKFERYGEQLFTQAAQILEKANYVTQANERFGKTVIRPDFQLQSPIQEHSNKSVDDDFEAQYKAMKARQAEAAKNAA